MSLNSHFVNMLEARVQNALVEVASNIYQALPRGETGTARRAIDGGIMKQRCGAWDWIIMLTM
jgi:hypothetical protein